MDRSRKQIETNNTIIQRKRTVFNLSTHPADSQNQRYPKIRKLNNYGTNRKTVAKTMVIYRKLWNFDIRGEKTWLITKNYETLNYNEKRYDY